MPWFDTLPKAHLRFKFGDAADGFMGFAAASGFPARVAAAVTLSRADRTLRLWLLPDDRHVVIHLDDLVVESNETPQGFVTGRLDVEGAPALIYFDTLKILVNSWHDTVDAKTGLFLIDTGLVWHDPAGGDPPPAPAPPPPDPAPAPAPDPAPAPAPIPAPAPSPADVAALAQAVAHVASQVGVLQQAVDALPQAVWERPAAPDHFGLPADQHNGLWWQDALQFPVAQTLVHLLHDGPFAAALFDCLNDEIQRRAAAAATAPAA